MKKILIVLLILVCSTISYAGIKEDYKKAKEEQKYRFLYEIREAKQRGRLALIRAKNNQRVSSRYRHRSCRARNHRFCYDYSYVRR